MPKRSKEDTEVTIQTIMDAVVDQFDWVMTKCLTPLSASKLGYPELGSATISRRKPISPLR